jgi:hypothetical protein
MSLPKISHPTTLLEVPSLKKSFRFRPFLVREEKILLMAKESADPYNILQSIKQVINNCSVDEKFDIDKLAIFDLEFLFLKLRAISIDNVVRVTYQDIEDDKPYEFDIDLGDVVMDWPKDQSSNIRFSTPNAGIVLKYPSAKLYDDKDFMDTNENYVFELILKCVDYIYVGDEVYNASDYSHDELAEYMEALDVKTFAKVREFLMNLPKMKYVIEYKNSLDHDRRIELNSLTDFFTW